MVKPFRGKTNPGAEPQTRRSVARFRENTATIAFCRPIFGRSGAAGGSCASIGEERAVWGWCTAANAHTSLNNNGVYDVGFMESVGNGAFLLEFDETSKTVNLSWFSVY